jgi:PAS domain S-box-containing protein
MRKFGLRGLARSLPLILSFVSMAIAGGLAYSGFARLDASNRMHAHNERIEQATETLLGDLADSQRGMRGYILSGRSDALDLYNSAILNIPRRLDALQSLVGAEPDRSSRLERVRSAASDVVVYSRRLLAGGDSVARSGIESTGEGLQVMNRARQELREFAADTQQRLDSDLHEVSADIRRTRQLILLIIALAAAVLLFSNFLARRQLRHRQRAESTLRQSEERFRLIVDGVSDHALFMLSPTGIVLSWNAGAKRLKGYDADEIIGKSFVCFYTQAQRRDGHPEEELRIAGTAGRYEEEGWRIRKDGSQFLANVVITALRDEDGNLRGFAKITRDITASRALDRAMAEQARILDLVNDTIFVRDDADRITYWNRGAERSYGWSKEEAIGHVTHTLLQTQFPQGLPQIRTMIAEKGHWEGELLHRRRDGSQVAVASRWVLQKSAGEPDRIIETNYDLTDRKLMEQALRNQNRDLELAAVAKDRFLANMSHELRTPLNAIIGFSELLTDGLPGPVNSEQREYLDDVLKNGRHLLHLINDLLDLSKLEAGKMQWYPEVFSLPGAVEEACAGIRPLLEQKKIALRVRVTPGLQSVRLDRRRFIQIMYNLLSNAVKFTSDGGHVDVAAGPLGSNQFMVSVCDDGVGISPHDLKRLFTDFEQLHDSAQRHYQGTGLGLSLTRNLVEALGGDIRVDSDVGKGSVFTVELPMTMPEAVS